MRFCSGAVVLLAPRFQLRDTPETAQSHSRQLQQAVEQHQHLPGPFPHLAALLVDRPPTSPFPRLPSSTGTPSDTFTTPGPMSYGYSLPPLGSTIPSDLYPGSASSAAAAQDQQFASSAALGLAAMSQAGSYHGGGRGSEDRESESVEPGGGGSESGGGGKGKDKDGKDIPPEGEKKKQTRGARACTVCRKVRFLLSSSSSPLFSCFLLRGNATLLT